MTNYTIRAATPADIPAITQLANRYTYDNLTKEEQKTGFLTGRFKLSAMQQMEASASSVVVQYHQEIVGFVINSKLPPANYPPLLQAMVREFPDLKFGNLPLADYSFFYYGPVLVDKSHRGKGLLLRMFRLTKTLLSSGFDIGVAFIHIDNTHSLKIHTDYLGLEVVGHFSFNTDTYHILAFSVTDARSEGAMI